MPAETCRQYDTGAKLFVYLDDWYLWIRPQCLLPRFALITAATRSVNLEHLQIHGDIEPSTVVLGEQA